MIKFAVCVCTITLCLLLAGCSSDPPVYIQQNHSLPTVEPAALKCIISNTTFYQKSYFIYHVTDIDDRVVYSPVGTYTMPENYSRWQLRSYPDKDDSLYTKTNQYIIARTLPNGEAVTCEETDELPSIFRTFIKNHEPLFRKNLYKASDEIEL